MRACGINVITASDIRFNQFATRYNVLKTCLSEVEKIKVKVSLSNRTVEEKGN